MERSSWAFDLLTSAPSPPPPPLDHADGTTPTHARTPQFSLTYIEIYNERCKDLLNPSDRDLDVREDPRKGNVVAGAVEVAVNSTQQILELMDRGTLYRTTEATNCNEVSSRSHAVLQVCAASS